MNFKRFLLLTSMVIQMGAASVVLGQIVDPVLTPSQGTSATSVTVTVTDATPGTTLYYTTNGLAPTTSSTTIASGSTLVINIGTTLKVQAYQGSANPSDVVTALYTNNGFVSTGPQHSVVLKNNGTVWATGANGSGQLATGNTTPATLPVQTTVTGASPVLGVTSKTSLVENGLPESWEIANFGQTGLNPSQLAPNGSGLTILQCYQQGINPQQTAPAEPFAVAVSATGPFAAPAYPVVVASVTHPSTATITSVDFRNVSNGYPGTDLGTVTQAPYQYTFTTPLQAYPYPSENYIIEAVATESTGSQTSATTQFVVNEPNFYQRGSGTDSVFLSTIVAIDSEKGQLLDGQQGTNSSNYFSNLYSTAAYPWFLRTQAESNELWKHIVTISSGTASYATFDVAPTISGSAVGGAPPLVAFGSQGGGTPIYTNQTYNFGVAAGGQLVFNPVTVSSVSSSVLTTATNHGLHVGQMIVISGGTGTMAINGTFLVATIPTGHPNELTLSTPSGTAVTLSGTFSGTVLITNADIKVEVYSASSFASNATNVAPVAVEAFTIPRQSNATAWTAFVNNGYVQDNFIGTVSTNTINFDTQIQFLPGSVVTQTYLQQVQYPLLITHKASNANYYYKVSYMGVTAPDDAAQGSYGTPVAPTSSDSAMAVDSAGNQVWNASYSLDFTAPTPWVAPNINVPQFQGTPLPVAYQDQSVDELIHDAPAVSDTLDAPGSGGLSTWNTATLTTLNGSPELRDHPELDQFVASLNNDPIALANYVLNNINLTDAVGYDANGNVTDQSINPQGVSRDALATFLEGEGSPAEQDALLIYFLRKAGYACGYVFPQQDQTLMFDQQLSSILRMQIRGAEGPSGGLNVPELIPVNYPWVAAYLPVNGTYKWVHIFPWIKDTVVNQGNDLWSYMPTGYQTGAQWALHYVMNDPTIRQLTQTGGSITDDINVLFPLYVQNQLSGSGVTMSELGTTWYNRQDYYTSWDQFPRPWQTPTISDSNVAQNLDYTQNPSALTSALQNIFDTISIQVLSDRNGNGVADAGEPVMNTGTLRLADIHDRRFLLYPQVTSAAGSTAPTYNLILSLEPYSSAHTAGPYTFNSTSSYTNTGGTTITNPDNGSGNPADLMNQQYVSVPLQTTTTSSNDDSILFSITYNKHLQAQSIPNINSLNPWNTFLGVQEKLTITDTRYLRKGDMAALCLDYGQVTSAMLEYQAEKYWNYQQTVTANPSTPVNPELAEGQILYLMGDTFYNKVAALKQSVESWTKTNDISWFEHGLSKLSPYRNSDGTPNLINNAVNLRYPRVDMAFQYTALVGNGSSDLASGDEGYLATDSAGELIVVGGSAYEHMTLNQFFQQASAISTVKLLDISQGWTPTTQIASHPGTGPVELTSSNYATTGTNTYSGSSGSGTFTHTLEYWCGWTNTSQAIPTGSIWYSINQVLSDPNYGPLSTVYVTPGPQNAVGQAGQAYTGMGGLTLGVGNYGAYITDNMVIDNGGYAGDSGDPFADVNSYTSPPAVGNTFSTSLNVIQASDGSLSLSYTGNTASTAASYTVTPIVLSSSDLNNVTSGLNNSSLFITPDDQTTLSLFDSQVTIGGSTGTISLTGANTASVNTLMATLGNSGSLEYYGTVNTFFGASGAGVADPVDSITGEFYINTADVTLNGPMPLEIRRTYGSLNPASNNFGYGWRLGYFPYLMVSSDVQYNTANTQVTTSPTLIYAAEMDGSVIAYRRQTSPNTRWLPQASDNPNLANASNGSIGGPTNPYNNRIDESTVNGVTVFTLTGADGSVRTFPVAAYPTSGSAAVSRARPYLQKWTDNRGNYYNFTFGSSSAATNYGQLSEIQSSNGNYITFDYDTYGHIIKAETGDGRTLAYQYDSFGDLIQVTLPDASTIQYAYQHATAPATAGTAIAGNGAYTNNSSNYALITSDNNIQITAATNSSTSTLTTASAHGLQVGEIVTISGALGNTAINGTYTVGTVPSTTTFTLLTGATSAAPYSTHLIVQETKPNGRILTNTYSSTNNYGARQVLTQSATVGTSGGMAQVASFNYGSPTKNTDGTYTGTTIITDVNSNTTTYKYTESQITEIDYPAQNGAETGQASNGPVMKETWYTTTGGGAYQRSLNTVTNRRGLQSTYTYDGNGNVLTVKLTGNLTGGSSNTETSTTTMTYNSTGSVTLPGGGSAIPNTLASVSDQLGNGASYSYGDTAHPYEPTTINALGGGSTISSATLQYSNMTSGTTGAYGLLVKQVVAVSTSDQAETDFTYNTNGFLTSKTQVTETNDPSVTTDYSYDLRGEMTSETNAASGRSKHYSYDALGHQTGAQVYDEHSNLESWAYSYFNQNGDLEWQQGPRYSPDDYITYQYDEAGRLTEQVKWLSAASGDASGVTSNGYATTVYQHDSAGNIFEMDDPNQNATTMTYDADGEMLGRVVHSGSNSGTALSNESFTYEPGGSVASHKSMLGSQESLSYTYGGQIKTDALVDATSGGNVNNTSYLYDLTGRVVQQNLTSGSYWKTVYSDSSRIVTRTLYNSGGTQLEQESKSFDRRGNVISQTDVSGNTFSTTYDGLNRVKTKTGPSATGSTAQQIITNVYDAGGEKISTTNANGERTDSYIDVEGRPTLISTFNANGSSSGNTGYWYSPDHQSVVTTVGSGGAGSANPAVTTTTYTDTEGHVVMLKHADGSAQFTYYDPVGNKTAFVDEQGATSAWSYDALGRTLNQSLDVPGGPSTNFTYSLNSTGETVTRALPGGVVSGKTTYDSAGRKTEEELDGSSNSVTRKFTYSYYSSGTGEGLLDQVVDTGRTITTTTTYDAWQRPSTVDSSGSSVAYQNQNTTYGYDNRGMVNSIVQSFATASTGASTQVTRGFDAYGQMSGETTYVNSAGTTSFTSSEITSNWSQTWNGAGRRAALNCLLTSTEGPGTGNYTYAYNADGLVTQVGIDSLTFSYAYGDNDLLQTRTLPLLTSTITQRDTRGRITAENVFGLNQTLLSESLTWRNDERLSNYTDSGPAVHAESRTYGYDTSDRISTEPYYNPSSLSQLAAGSQTANYGFDQTSVGGSNVTSGLGIRTEQNANANTGYVVTAQDSFERPTADADQPGNGAAGTIDFSYDGAGNATNRNIVSGATQTLYWDAYNHLVKVSQRNSGTSDFDWTTVYDGLGRRAQTTYQPMSSGVNNGSAVPLTYYYDPQVKYLELGILDGTRQWKVYGPDRDGFYGGLQGCGGIDGYVDETSGSVYGSINNFFGDSIGQTSSSGGGGFGEPLGGYGVLLGNGLPDMAPIWRSRYLDWTQFYCMGARYYDPLSGRFLSADPAGYDASASLYDLCGGDPVNGFDPDGRDPVSPEQQEFSLGYSQQMMSDVGMLLGTNPQGLNQAITATNPLLSGNLTIDPALTDDTQLLTGQQTPFESGQTAANVTVGAGAVTLFTVALASRNTEIAGDLEAGGMRAFAEWLGFSDSTAPTVEPTAGLTPIETPAPVSVQADTPVVADTTITGLDTWDNEGGAPAATPNPLQQGQIIEDQALSIIGSNGKVTFTPTEEQINSAAFSVVVGTPQYTDGGAPVSTIYDGSTSGGLAEIKSGDSELSSTYQLRLQTYGALINNQPLTIYTSRPVNSTFDLYLQRWGVTVEPLPPGSNP